MAEQDHLLIRRETAIPGFRYLLHPDRLASLLETACGIRLFARFLQLDAGIRPKRLCIAI